MGLHRPPGDRGRPSWWSVVTTPDFDADREQSRPDPAHTFLRTRARRSFGTRSPLAATWKVNFRCPVQKSRRSLEETPAPDPLRRLVVNSHGSDVRSEEHTSELQSRGHLVCRLLLEK